MSLNISYRLHQIVYFEHLSETIFGEHIIAIWECSSFMQASKSGHFY